MRYDIRAIIIVEWLVCLLLCMRRSFCHRSYLACFIFSAIVLTGSQIRSLLLIFPSIDNNNHGEQLHPSIDSPITTTTTTSKTSTTTVTNNNDNKNSKNNNLLPTVTEKNTTLLLDARSPYAYAFLVAGCDPDNPTYRGFFYNVLVSAHLLKTHGSTADIIVLLQMSQRATASSLPWKEEHMLYESGIRFRYLPTPAVDTFYSAMMAKFTILDLIEYERVLYLDADVMPLCSLDHLFHLSSKKVGLLKENMIVAWWKEPASGGYFMLQPAKDDWSLLQQIVALQRNNTSHHHWPYFDPIQGWGHVIQPPDYWMSLLGHRGTNWTFQFAFADQGLLYHWVKYVKRSVSIVFGPELWNWSDQNGELVVENKYVNVLANYTCPRFPWESPNGTEVAVVTKPVYRDLKHFTGSRKPWVQWKKVGLPPVIQSAKDAKNPFQLWFHILRTLRDERQWQIDVDHLNFGKPILGKYPTLYQMAQQQ